MLKYNHLINFFTNIDYWTNLETVGLNENFVSARKNFLLRTAHNNG